MYHKILDEAIRLHLSETGKTQGQLARELGMSEGSLRWKRRGSREFTVAEAARIANITGLEVGLAQLLGRPADKA